MVEKENKPVSDEKRQMRRGTLTTDKVKRFRDTPLYPLSGNVTMATNGQTYRFPNPYGGKHLQFIGVVVRENQNGYVLTVNALSRIPVAGKSYYLSTNPDHTIVIRGSSSSTSIQATPTNPDYPSIPNGLWLESASTDDLFGNSRITVTASSVPSINIRSMVNGIAHLRKAFYYSPESASSVGIAKQFVDPDGNEIIVQCGNYMLIVDENVSASTPEYAASATEGHLVNIVWNSTIVARATVVGYDNDSFEVKVTLFDNWYIVGNFICT